MRERDLQPATAAILFLIGKIQRENGCLEIPCFSSSISQDEQSKSEREGDIGKEDWRLPGMSLHSTPEAAPSCFTCFLPPATASFLCFRTWFRCHTVKPVGGSHSIAGVGFHSLQDVFWRNYKFGRSSGLFLISKAHTTHHILDAF